jgi:hypothetical protein
VSQGSLVSREADREDRHGGRDHKHLSPYFMRTSGICAELQRFITSSPERETMHAGILSH